MAKKIPNIVQKVMYDPLFMYVEHKIIPGKTPEDIDFLQIEICNRCNLRCPSCDLARRNSISSDITFEKFKKIISKFPKLKAVDLAAVGEPTLHKELTKIISHCTKKGLVTYINSNGTLLTKEKAKSILEAGLTRLHISVDAATPKVFEALRLGAKFNDVKVNVQSTVKMIQENGYKTVVAFNSAVSRTNWDELPKIIELATELGVKELTVEGIHQWGKEKINPSISFFRMSLEEVLPTAVKAAKLAAANDIDITLPPLDRLGQESDLDKYLCFWPWNAVTILANGDVVACCIGVIPCMIFGNIYKQSFEEIWHSENYQKFRDDFIKRKLNETCSTCQMLLSFGLHRSKLGYLINKIKEDSHKKKKSNK